MVEKISRSEQKRLYKQVEELAGELAELSDSDLKLLPAEDEVRQEIVNCRGLQTGARKRQIKYLAKVLRRYPLDEVYSFMQARKGSALKTKQLFHRAEHWRDVLITEAVEMHEESLRSQQPFALQWHSDLISGLMEELPGIDENDLRRALHHYGRTRNRTYYKEVFRMIKAAVEAQDRAMS